MSHEDYGYDKAFRNQVLRDADTYGVTTAAAKHNVSRSSIYRWRQELAEQESWIDISARHLTMENVAIVLAVFVGIVAAAHAITFFLGR